MNVASRMSYIHRDTQLRHNEPSQGTVAAQRGMTYPNVRQIYHGEIVISPAHQRETGPPRAVGIVCQLQPFGSRSEGPKR